MKQGGGKASVNTLDNPAQHKEMVLKDLVLLPRKDTRGRFTHNGGKPLSYWTHFALSSGLFLPSVLGDPS